MSKIIVICVVIILLISVLLGLFKKSNKISSEKYENVKIIIDKNVINSNDVQKVIEPLWWSVSIYDGEEQYYKDLERFSTPQKYVFAIQWYIAEVNNGGHDQFYFNSTGIVWEDVLKGFEVIGLKENYDILKESVDRLGGYPSKDRTKRQNQLEKYNSQFDDLDDKFYETENIIEQALIKYIRENEKDFLFSDNVKIPK